MIYFVDTNVLVYARDATDPSKQTRARQWLEFLWNTRQGRLSVQVLQEFYAVVTTKLTHSLPPIEARDDVRALYVWDPLPIDESVIEGAWRIQDRQGYSWWDSLIVSAAQTLSCDYLLTEDLQHRQPLDGLTVIDPFAADAGVPSA